MITFRKHYQGWDILQTVHLEGHVVFQDKQIGVIFNNILDGHYYASIYASMIDAAEADTIAAFIVNAEDELINEQAEYM